jgi:hypothetical protein
MTFPTPEFFEIVVGVRGLRDEAIANGDTELVRQLDSLLIGVESTSLVDF